MKKIIKRKIWVIMIIKIKKIILQRLMKEKLIKILKCLEIKLIVLLLEEIFI